jgi:hypothetical protein
MPRQEASNRWPHDDERDANPLNKAFLGHGISLSWRPRHLTSRRQFLRRTWHYKVQLLLAANALHDFHFIFPPAGG